MTALASLSNACLYVCLSSSHDVILFCQVLKAEWDTFSSSFEGMDSMPMILNLVRKEHVRQGRKDCCCPSPFSLFYPEVPFPAVSQGRREATKEVQTLALQGWALLRRDDRVHQDAISSCQGGPPLCPAWALLAALSSIMHKPTYVPRTCCGCGSCLAWQRLERLQLTWNPGCFVSFACLCCFRTGFLHCGLGREAGAEQKTC